MVEKHGESKTDGQEEGDGNGDRQINIAAL